MTGLQEAFYIIGIIYMGVSLLIIIALAIAVGVIRNKIVALENTVREKLETIASIPSTIETIISNVKNLTKHSSK
jgi:uncharacterized protein YoxC